MRANVLILRFKKYFYFALIFYETFAPGNKYTRKGMNNEVFKV